MESKIKRTLCALVVVIFIIFVIYMCVMEYAIDLCNEDGNELKPVNISKGTCKLQFNLSKRIKATVCLADNRYYVLDIRQFIGNRTTIKGIQLLEYEWKRLYNVFPEIKNQMHML